MNKKIVTKNIDIKTAKENIKMRHKESYFKNIHKLLIFLIYLKYAMDDTIKVNFDKYM